MPNPTAPRILPRAAQALWLAAFTAAYNGTNAATAAAAAWARIKQSYRKDRRGRWVTRDRLGVLARAARKVGATAAILRATQQAGFKPPRRLVFETDQEFSLRAVTARTRPKATRKLSPRLQRFYNLIQRGEPRKGSAAHYSWRRARSHVQEWEAAATRRLVKRASARTPDVEPQAPGWFNLAQVAAEGQDYRQLVDWVTPILMRDLREIVAADLSPESINLAVSEAVQAKPRLGDVGAAWSAILEAIDAAEARLATTGQVASISQLRRAVDMLRARLADHFGGGPEQAPPEGPSVSAMLAASFRFRASARREHRAPEPVRSAAEVLRSVITMGSGAHGGYFDRVKAAHHPSKLRAIVRGSVGLDRQDQNPMSIDLWTAAPAPYLGAFPHEPAPQQTVLNTALSLTQSDRPDGLHFASKAMELLYAESLRRPPGVPVTGHLGDPVLAAQQRMIREHLAGAIRAAIAEVGT
jgi:cation transport regulator ChaB